MGQFSLKQLFRPLNSMRGGHRVIQVCACNDPETFQRYAAASVGIAKQDQVRFDNCVENKPVPTRYNQFIEALPDKVDAWLAFVHNDFQFHEDPAEVLATASPAHIYGAVGANIIEQAEPTPGVPSARQYEMVGQVACSTKLIASGWCGDPVTHASPAKTLDCCCVIVHSSLVRQNRLRFNERYEWHFYSEEFSLRAYRDHGIATFVLPFKSGHYGRGATNQSFFDCRRALYDEYPETFVSTCFNPFHQPAS